MGVVQSLRPNELGSAGGIVTFEMSFEARRRLGVLELRIAERFSAYLGETRIVFEKFGSSIDVIVIVIVLAIVIEPRLHTFGVVLVVVHTRVFSLPQPGSHRHIVRCLQA